MMATAMAIGNIGIGNTSTLATLNKDLGKKCFGFTKMDASAIRGIKKSAFAATGKGSGK